MKKTIITLLLTVLLVQGQAQLRDIMLKKAGEKMNGKKENASTGTQPENTGATNTGTSGQETPAQDTGNQNAGTQQNTSNPYAAFGMGQGSKEIKPTYKFEQNVLMEMKKYDKKGNVSDKDIHKTRMHFGSEAYGGMEAYDDKNQSRGMSIFDSEKKQMIMLMENDGKKIAMVRNFDPSQYVKKEGKEGEKKPTITKTGRTKKVCGYDCEEWLMTDEAGKKTEMWVSSEVPIKASGFYSMFSNNKEMAKYFGSSSDYPSGMMLEMTSYEENGEKFSMTATEVNVNAPKTIETKEYTVY